MRNQGLAPVATSRITGLSERLVSTYLDLADEYGNPEYQRMLDHLLLRYAPLRDEGAFDE